MRPHPSRGHLIAVCLGLLLAVPAAARGQPHQIILGGHMYGLDQNPSPGYQNAVGSIAAYSPEAILIGGDLTENGSPLQWDNLFAAFSSWTFPLIPVIGNHDAENRGEWLARFGSYYFTDDVGSTRIIALDMVLQPNSYPDPAQITFLLQAIADAKNDIAVTDVIISTHKLFWMKTHPRYENVHAFAHNWHTEFESKGNDVNAIYEDLWATIVDLGSTKPTTIFAGDSGWTNLGPNPCLFYDVLDGVTLLACGTDPDGNTDRDAAIVYESDAGAITLTSFSLWGTALNPLQSYDVAFWEAFFAAAPGPDDVLPPGPTGLPHVQLPGGQFEMGDHVDPKTEVYSPTTGYDVTLSPYHVATQEVTVGQYLTFLNDQGTNDCGGEECVDLDDPDCPIEDLGGGSYGETVPGTLALPVTEVTWFGALAYCNYQSVQDGFDPVYTGAVWDRGASGWRLPTEAEHEYAIRAGSGYTPGQTLYYRFGWGTNEPHTVRDHANYYGTGGADVYAGLADVGSFPPTAFGLYDISGNAFEWVYDPWTWEFDRPPVAIDPVGAGSISYENWRGIRGGGYNFHWRGSANGYRSALPEGEAHSYVGFRLARNATPPNAIVDLAATQVRTGNDPGSTTFIDVAWSPTDPGTRVDVYRKGVGYPEYDDPPNLGTLPTTPLSPVSALNEGWALAGSSMGTSLRDAPLTRDFYSYVAFAVDAIDNVSAVSNLPQGALSYHLGDFSNGVTAGVGNNFVGTEDVSTLGAKYGDTLVADDPWNFLDAGPTNDGSVSGMPVTDDLIDFEDLILMALNFNTVSKAPETDVPSPSSSNRLVAYVPDIPAPRETFDVVLWMEAAADLWGVSLALAWDPGAVEPTASSPGELLTSRRDGLLLSSGPGAVDAVLLGRRASGLSGTGMLARIQFRVLAAGPSGIELRTIVGRDASNLSVPIDAQVAKGQWPATRPLVSTLHANVPNPFNPTTDIRFDLARAGRVRVLIYATNGRLVRTLTNQRYSAGQHVTTWNGKDQSGATVSSGVYFYRLEAPDITRTRRMVLVK